ncbi:hypothetical protein SEA_CAPTAINREX_41 [Microbacterium phage CaptainRex]|nr:hypothetical protein SEA_ZEPP_41 [Microbacterium phage Zepp]QZD99169.1 hypothetical protein SEA_HASITHA_41 [Microbacterium phage Hasitha]UVK59198.1 hypothetical protein SEA_LIBRIE_41 [Microbacterium phage Librie]WIC89871.1 hypothetical protein SEA_CAPTAINREX_41 [Microbacterium phage CaptainRex]
MYPITSYTVTPDLLGRTRWMAEIDGQHSRFARRAYSREAAERKIAHDENAYWDGHITFMQRWFLPAAMPVRRLHDRLCQAVQRRRKVRRAR